ncbi:MAG: hypothetical protein AAFQ64_07960 [Pseudomonadota bacterium]
MFREPENGYFALALTCAVLLFTIALVSWGVPYSKGYKRADQDHQAAYATHQASEEHERKCRGEVSIDKALSCYRDAYNTDREQERAEEDLDAQREMANWAEGMLWATVAVGGITAGVTALGVWFVAKTLKATSDTLLAAREANNIMRNDQRPWLYCDSAKRIGKEVEFGLRNEGRTPAHSCEIHYDVFYYHPESGLIDSPISSGGFNKLGSIFPSENAFSVTGVQVLEDFEGLHPFKAIHIRGVVTYIDPVSENPKKSPFLFIEVNGDGEFRRYGENNAN